MGKVGCYELYVFVHTSKKKSNSSTLYFFLILQTSFDKIPIQAENSGRKHKTAEAPAVDFLSALWSKTSLCPMNGGRNLRLSHIAEEKNNPGVSSNEEKSEPFLSTDVFTMSAKTAVVTHLALFLYSRSGVFYTYRLY